ncbi:LptA/OstA family protein [uncultured Fretibacterium sp.]|uniref:LptA/OstA family protein n=1 Tax=uncultured Fretibacterium sp. TaxID=1678694 RepID=UPI002617F951|nr:LptA/OstA family protein [uncultured Fretibacterium sp.]
MRMRRTAGTMGLAALLVLWLAGAAFAADEQEFPDKAKLSANRMRFDSTTGDFLAEGEVLITADGLTVRAPRGSGNVPRREAAFDSGVTASGTWMGDAVDLKAGRLTLNFAEAPTCRLQDGVKGAVGTMGLDADRVTLIGAGGVGGPTEEDQQTKFWIVGAHRLEDRAKGLTFGADSIEGVLQEGALASMTAKDRVWVKGRPKQSGEPVSINGDHALYSLQRGSVVLSGRVVAVQGGRTLRSDSIVYFPDQNRVEALGGITRSESGTVSADRAEITIDLKRERRK